MTGIRAAATGLIAFAAWKLGKQVLTGKGVFEWALALASFVIIAFFDVNAVWVILGSIAVGILYSLVLTKRMKTAETEKREGEQR